MTPAAEDLDRLLAGWAASVRMTDVAAEQVRQAILTEPVGGLEASWWRDFSTQLSGVMVQAGRAGRAGWTALPAYR